MAGAASAQDRAARFAERDPNRDGVLSREEYTSTGGHPGNFRALDMNSDGVLSRGEFVNRSGSVEDEAVYTPQAAADRASPAAVTALAATTNASGQGPQPRRPADPRGVRRPADLRPRGPQRRRPHQLRRVPEPAGRRTTRQEKFDALDRNRDGVVSRAEWTNEAGVFHLADRNGDGVVTVREYLSAPAGQTYEAALRAAGPRRRRRDRAPRWPAGEPAAFDRADRNNDGAVTRWEFANAAAARPPGAR